MAMVGVLGQYFFLFEIEGVGGNFLGDKGKIHQFVMEEKMGGDTPVFKLSFSTLDRTIQTKLHEGAHVTCVFGRTMTESKTAFLRIQSFNIEEGEFNGAFYLKITIAGFVEDSIKYIREPKQKAFRFKQSKEAIIGTASDYFQVVDRTSEDTNDVQTWIRAGVPAIRFIHDTWKHSYISDDNFLIYGVNFHKEFVITDLKAMMSKEPKWILQGDYTGSAPNISSYNPNVQMVSDFGLMNQFSVYTKVTPKYNCITGSYDADSTPGQCASLTSGKANISTDATEKYTDLQIFDQTNVHKNYHKSILNNMTKTALQNSAELNITVERKWSDYELFDLVIFIPQEVKGVPSSLKESLGGVYAITRISRYYADERACTLLTISRDGMNNLSGGGLYSWGSVFGNISSSFLNRLGNFVSGGLWDFARSLF